MKIGVITGNIWGSVNVELVEALARMGHEVAVLAWDARAPSATTFLRLRENGVDYDVIHDRRRSPWVWFFDKITQKSLRTRRFATELLAA